LALALPASWRSRPGGPETCWTRRAPAQSSPRSGLIWLVSDSNRALARCVYLFGSGRTPPSCFLHWAAPTDRRRDGPRRAREFPGDCRRCSPGL